MDIARDEPSLLLRERSRDIYSFFLDILSRLWHFDSTGCRIKGCEFNWRSK